MNEFEDKKGKLNPFMDGEAAANFVFPLDVIVIDLIEKLSG